MENFNHSCKDEPTAKLRVHSLLSLLKPTASSVEGVPETTFRSDNLLE